jgi:hypothetical protein
VHRGWPNCGVALFVVGVPGGILIAARVRARPCSWFSQVLAELEEAVRYQVGAFGCGDFVRPAGPACDVDSGALAAARVISRGYGRRGCCVLKCLSVELPTRWLGMRRSEHGSMRVALAADDGGGVRGAP